MYDKKIVIPGLVIFLAVVTLPFWIKLGGGSSMPKPVVMKNTSECVESPEFMRANHMQLLDQWRHEVVREGQRIYTSSSGKKFNKSLTKTCLDCHANKKEFCDSCHKSVAVKLYCFSCHLVPGQQLANAPKTEPGRGDNPHGPPVTAGMIQSMTGKRSP